MFNPDSKWYVGASRVVTWLASGHSRVARTQILNNYNRQQANRAYPNPDVLICTTGKLGVGENLTGGNWLVLFEPLNSVTTWKQAAARNVRLGMTEPTRLFQFETDAPYERLMLDRLASRETSQQMVKAVLGEDILRELGMLPKQSTRAMGESESQRVTRGSGESRHIESKPRTQGSWHRCVTESFRSSPEFNGHSRCAADATKGSDAHGVSSSWENHTHTPIQQFTVSNPMLAIIRNPSRESICAVCAAGNMHQIAIIFVGLV